jgi:HAE1 family hydrophobic/amphiphilic exporter-1
MGFVIIGGMLFASFIAIFLVPVLYYLIEKIAGKKKPVVTDPPPPPQAHA